MTASDGVGSGHPQTMAEKILAAHAGVDAVSPGEFVECSLDIVMSNDVTAPMAIDGMAAMGCDHVFDAKKSVFVCDHYVPNKDIKSAENADKVRRFVRAQGISHYWEVGRMGIEHALLPEQGVVVPGDLVIGADSHTCTYGALGAFATGGGSTDAAVAYATGKLWFRVPASSLFILDGELQPDVSAKDLILHIIGMIGVDGALYQAMEFTGSTISALGMDGRMTMANMAIEAGAKAGLFAVDDVTRAYEEGRAERPGVEYASDPGAVYAATYRIDASQVPLTVACPHLPSNTRPASGLSDVEIDQVVIGSCTNGRIDDMRTAAAIIAGQKVASGVRCIVIPATQAVFAQCIEEGIAEAFVEAGCVFSTPTCGPCLGGYMGVLAAGERAVSTTNRNFVGRMGDTASEVYLASPAVAAASAVLGRIGVPAEVRGE